MESLRQYRPEFDEKNQTFKETHLKNWATHGADAFRYLAVAYRNETKAEPPPAPVVIKSLPELTYDEFFTVEKSSKREQRV